MFLDHLPIGDDPPREVNVVIEVPIGGEPIKYELDKAACMLVVDRFLYTPMRYPGNYGFIPHTLSEDGDPCDVLVANTRPLMPGAAIAVRPVGVLKMTDEAGGDEKILAVPVGKIFAGYAHIEDLAQVSPHWLERIGHFFEHYKDLEPGKWVKIGGWHGVDRARQMILEGIERARASK